jgi:hypothetical protein
MYEMILADLRRKVSDAVFKMGARYYRTLKNLYRPPEDAISRLQGPSPAMPIAGDLLKAARQTKLARPVHGPMVAYLGSGATLNKTEVVGACTWAIGLSVTSEKQLGPALAFLRWAASEKLKDNHPVEYEILLPWIESALLAVWGRGKTALTSPAAFVGVNREILGLVLPLVQLDDIVNCNNVYTSVRAQLDDVVSASPVGQAMYAFAMTDLLCDSVRVAIEQHVVSFLRENSLSVVLLNKYKYLATDACDKVANVDLLPARRIIVVKLGAAEVSCAVGAIATEVSLRFAAAWKPLAVVATLLPQLWCENVLDVGTVVQFKGKIEECLLHGVRAARESVKRAVDTMEEKGSQAIINLVRAKKASWLFLDSEFHLEVSMMDTLAGESSEKRLIDKVLAVMPSSTNGVNIDALTTSLDAIRGGAAFSLATLTAQAKFSLVRLMVGRVRDGKPPGVSDVASDIVLAPFIARLVYMVSAPGAKKGAKLFGAAAVEAILHDCKDKDTKGTLVDADIKPLIVWGYLLVGARAKDVQALIGKFDKASKGSLKKLADSSAKKKRADEDLAMKEALSMFGS